MYKPIHQNKINGLWINVLVVKSITITLETTTVFYDYFPVFDCWGDLILSEFQNQFCACSVQPGQKCELGFLFNAKIPAPLRVKYCVIVRGVDKGYIECLNKYNYVTVWFIVGRNIAIVPQKQCCQVPIVEGTESRYGHIYNIFSAPNQHTLIIIYNKRRTRGLGRGVRKRRRVVRDY